MHNPEAPNITPLPLHQEAKQFADSLEKKTLNTLWQNIVIDHSFQQSKFIAYIQSGQSLMVLDNEDNTPLENILAAIQTQYEDTTNSKDRIRIIEIMITIVSTVKENCKERFNLIVSISQSSNIEFLTALGSIKLMQWFLDSINETHNLNAAIKIAVANDRHELVRLFKLRNLVIDLDIINVALSFNAENTISYFLRVSEDIKKNIAWNNLSEMALHKFQLYVLTAFKKKNIQIAKLFFRLEGKINSQLIIALIEINNNDLYFIKFIIDSEIEPKEYKMEIINLLYLEAINAENIEVLDALSKEQPSTDVILYAAVAAKKKALAHLINFFPISDEINAYIAHFEAKIAELLKKKILPNENNNKENKLLDNKNTYFFRKENELREAPTETKQKLAMRQQQIITVLDNGKHSNLATTLQDRMIEVQKNKSDASQYSELFNLVVEALEKHQQPIADEENFEQALEKLAALLQQQSQLIC